MKKFLSSLVILLVVLSSATPAHAANTTYTSVNHIAEICFLGYNNGTRGPIMMTRGTLYSNGSSKQVYMICLSGTEYIKNQTTWIYTDLLSGFNQDNQYLKNVVNVISRNVPKNANLFLAGHSLGGMIAQQVAADSSIKANYNVLNTVTFGSPLISAGSREGTVIRLGDTADVVPYLSATGALLPAWQIAGLNREDGGYGNDFVNAHNYSYRRYDVWGRYDVTGQKNGSARLTYDYNAITYYRSDY